MITRGLIDQLLKSGGDMLQGKTGQNPFGGNTSAAPQAGANQSSPLSSMLAGAGGGALAASAIGLLMGSKKARKMGGKVVTYGGLAALGFVAYKAYSNWQKQNQTTVSQAEPQTVDRIAAAQVEEHSHAVLRAIIGAAKADGHIDDRERQLIDEEVGKLNTDTELLQWLDSELRKPLDPSEVARAAKSPEMAAEMYLASKLMVDEESFMERAYLQELAQQLKLDPALKLELDKQAVQALA